MLTTIVEIISACVLEHTLTVCLASKSVLFTFIVPFLLYSLMPRGKKQNNTPATTGAANKRRALAPSESTTNRPQMRSSGQKNKRNEEIGSRDNSTEQADLRDPPSSSPVHMPQPLTREDIPALVLEVVKSLTPALTSAQGTSSSFIGARESVTRSPAAGTSTNVTTGRGVQGTDISSDRDRSESTAHFAWWPA